MKIIELKLYSFNELSAKAKEKAKSNYINSGYFADHLSDDYGKSLEKFCEIFNIKNWNIDFLEPYRNTYKFDQDENIRELEGIRLTKYLWNNFANDLYKPKFIGSLKTNEYIKHKRVKSPLEPNKIGNRFNPYYSGFQLSNDCILTGVYCDYELLQPIYSAMQYKELNTSFEDLISECISKMCKAFEKDYEYLCSDEAINEDFESNEIEFLETGEQSQF